MQRPTLTIGIEEEYLLVDKKSRDVVADPPDALMKRCVKALGKQATNEFLRSQVEVGTKVCHSIEEAREDLKRLRLTVAAIADDFGIAPIAASTHPFARWEAQKHTQKKRYDVLAEEMAATARRLMICGMHVHVGVEDDELRIDLLNQAAYFLPHLLALSTSSPYWQGQDTGLASYRLTVFDALPRTGMPDVFDSYADYRRFVSQLTDVGILQDATKVWWDIRPSDRFPTLEARVMDVCTSFDDALSIAALFQCLISMLTRLRARNQRWRIYPNTLLEENRWRAQRYGAAGDLVDFGKGKLIPLSELVEELMAMLRTDAEALGCLEELEHAETIVERGTSSQHQRAAYDKAIEGGASHEEGLKAVVDWLIGETVAGL